MMNNSSSGLLPIMDGLICWLDGRYGHTNTKYWIDKTGNKNDVTFKEDTVFKDNYLILDGINYGSMPNILHNKNCGIFIKFRVDIDYEGFVHILCKSTFAITLSINLNRFRLYNYHGVDGDTNTPELEKGKDHVIYVGDTFLMIDGLFYNKNYSNSSDPIEEVQLGAYRNGQIMKGRIYSIMIYNRSLTKEEVQYNYLYEQSIERGE